MTRSLNNERADLLFMQCFKHEKKDYVPSTDYIAAIESFVRPYSSPFKGTRLVVDSSLESCLKHFTETDSSYFISSTDQYRVIFVESTKTVYLWFLHAADSEDVIRGLYHASYIRYLAQQSKIMPSKCALELESAEYVNVHFKTIFKQMQLVGWHTHFTFLSDQRARIIIEK